MYDVHHELREKLVQQGEGHRIENLNIGVLQFLVEFLLPFYDAQRELEGDKYPTINLVMIWVEKLKRHCQPSVSDLDTSQ